MNKKETARLILDFMHRAMMHHAMWYGEIQHQLGREKALDILTSVCDRSFDIQMKRLSKSLGFDMKEDVPAPLLNMSDQELVTLKESIAANWLANDGVWFQAVEFTRGMTDAKRCNDSCWAQFSPFEAWSVKRFLNLPENSGLEGLKKAMEYRLYAAINEQSITDVTSNSFIFSMNTCRVQAARKRKGLDDYPCKSGGMVEFTTFAETIDPEIKTECIGCPPDEHPDEWYCSWKFTIDTRKNK